MPLLAFGINHQSAPLAIREKTIFTPDSIPVVLQDLVNTQAVNEAMLLCTCNRTELYSDCLDVAHLTAWLATQHRLAVDELDPHLYFHKDDAAVRHILRVASGLDSVILGEPQILGQMKHAYGVAKKAGAVGPQLEHLLQKVFFVSKQVRTGSEIGANPVTIAYSVIDLTKRIFADLKQCRVLLIGAGESTRAIATHLYGQGMRAFVVANRSEDRGLALAKQVDGRAIQLAEIPIYLKEADIVITATASDLPLIGKGMIESALKARKHKPIFIADLAVPRDVEAEVGQLEDVYLYNVDDLQRIVASNQTSREKAAKQADQMINQHLEAFTGELRALDAVGTICDYRNKIEAIIENAQKKAKHQLAQGESVESVLAAFSRRISQKVMHHPTTQLRQAAYEGDVELLLLARRLLGISDP